QSSPSTSPPAGVMAAFHVSKEILLALMERTLPSPRPTRMVLSRLRGPAQPPVPPQLTSRLLSFGPRPLLHVPRRDRPSIQLAQRSPAMCLPSLKSCAPASSFNSFSASFL